MAMTVEKDLSVMGKVHLEGVPFQTVDMVPTFVNFIFGMNGTGKTTLGRLLASSEESITWREDVKQEEYERCVFNRDFVEKNIQPNQTLPGLFMMGEANIDTTGELAALQQRKGEVLEEEKRLVAAWQVNQKAKENLFSFFAESAWAMTKEDRKDFAKCLGKAKGSKRRFGVEAFQLVREAPAVAPERDELLRLYQDVYASDFKQYPTLPSIPDPEILDHVPGQDILSTAIVSRQDSPFSAFIHALGAADWVRKGHEAFHEKSEGRCPYCQQALPENFEKQLAEAFDAHYEEQRQQIVQFGRAYQQAAETLLMPLRQLSEASFQVGSWQDFTARLMMLETAISSNMKTIREKWESPSKVVEITPLAVQLGDLSDMLHGWNQEIQAHNEALQNNATKQAQCTGDVRAYLGNKLAGLVQEYQLRLRHIQDKEKELQAQHGENQKTLQEVQSQLAETEKNYVNTQVACQQMNELLQRSGFHNFHLQEKGDPSVYEVVREDGTVAEKLSEGERQFLGFLYFYYLMDSQGADGNRKKRIVIIDDPSTGLDSRTKEAVASLAKELITACLMQADETTYAAKFQAKLQAPIVQLFLLTHDSAFQRAVSSGLEQEWKSVSYFLLQKEIGGTRLVPCVRAEKKQVPQNENPIPGSYQSLWELYRTSQDTETVLKAARDIVNVYFIDILGYTKGQLREELLRQRMAFCGNDPSRIAAFRLTFSFLSYLDSAVETLAKRLSVAQVRQVFGLFFTLLHAEGYYRRMTS